MDQISAKVQKAVEEENRLFEKKMAATRDAHWQERVVEALKKVADLEDEVEVLRARTAELEAAAENVHEITEVMEAV